jgi:hypothetical protein
MWGLWASAARASASEKSCAPKPTTQSEATKTRNRKSQVSYALCLFWNLADMLANRADVRPREKADIR